MSRKRPVIQCRPVAPVPIACVLYSRAERASEVLQDLSKSIGFERTAAAGCRSGIFADHVSPIVNGHIYFDPVELGRSPPYPVRVLLQGGHIAIAVRKNSVLRLLLGKAVGGLHWARPHHFV
jgi:hypothetical protein